jgi:cytochrome P450
MTQTTMTDPGNAAGMVDGVNIREAVAHMGRNAIEDIYTVFEDARAKSGPVHLGDIIAEEFQSFSPASTVVPRPVVTVLGMAEANAVYRDPATFSNDIYMDTVGKSMGRNLLMVDPPEHTRLRKGVQAHFGKRQIESLSLEFAQRAVGDSLRTLAPRHRANIFEDFILWLPANVVFGMLGLPDEQKERFRTYATGLQLTATDVAATGMLCSARLSALLQEFLAGYPERRAAATESTGMIDDIIASQPGDEAGLTADEILDFLRVLLPAGSETTIAGVAGMFAALLTHQEQLELVRNDPALLPNVIEEILRWQAPNQFNYRITTTDTRIGDVPVAAGTGVIIAEGACNRDPERWDRPDEFDITRKLRPNVAFGGGVHVCLGAHLGRFEMGVALSQALERLPGLRLDPEHPAPRFVGLHTRTVDAIHAQWD